MILFAPQKSTGSPLVRDPGHPIVMIDIADILAAADRLEGVIVDTPLITSSELDQRVE